MTRKWDAVVIGSGPNGLSAGVALARKGLAVRVYEAASTPGGGARTSELTLPGFRHDVCSSVHPFGIGSPFFQALPLARFGLDWAHPEVALAHPLDGGRAGALYASLERTRESLGEDGGAWVDLFEPFMREWPRLAKSALRPLAAIPEHPLLMAKFGLKALWPAWSFANRSFETEEARALFLGMAGHSMLPSRGPFTASFGLMLGAAGHAVGWPFARGGSAAITDALAAYLREFGGEIVCEQTVRSMDDLPPARAYLFDVTPRQLLEITGDRFSGLYRRQLERYRQGPGVFKLDYALSGPMPWTAEACRRAGTLHVCGGPEEVEESERAVSQGQLPERPLIIAAQASLADDTRAPAGQHTLWAYCHVPNGSTEDMSARIEAQFDRFAPGWRDLVLGRVMQGTSQLHDYNANYVGGDIAGGSHGGLQMFFRPAIRLNPYTTPDPSIFLCSSSTPPGGGVHGMCGYHAARAAWVRHFR
ncbi:MAG: NAD(P)/FAD-dependent oxidoreductase [Dehalococcoidia bacterium]